MQQLNQIRLDADLTIADISRIAGVTDDVACRWLSGIEQPDDHHLQLLAAALGIDAGAIATNDTPVERRRMERLRGRFATADRRSSLRPGG
jgi:transcriptional regulator with XRE-family HTH domain